MAKNNLSSLLRIHEKALRDNRRETQDSVEILKRIVQYCIEINDEKSAYMYQKKVCDACTVVYGSNNITTKNAELYCRELMIRTSPLSERVRLCRDYWRDAKREYGESSYLVRILAPLYLMCCSEANELEELKIVCAEVVNYFGNNNDYDSRELVALCSDFEAFSGENSRNAEKLIKTVQKTEALFGKDSLMSLRVQNEIGNIYRKNREFEKAVNLYRRLYHISAEKHGKYLYDTIVFQKNYVLNLALSGKYRKALSEVEALEKAIEKCPEKNRCPDAYECYVCIYMGLGKKELANKYGRLSIANNQKILGNDDLTTAKGKFFLAANEFSEDYDNNAAFSEMIKYMQLKEQWMYNLFLLSSDASRENAFNNQNSGEYDVCFGLALSALEHLSEDDVISLWEIACNYKSLIGDCELLHNVISRNPKFLEKEKTLQEKIKSGNTADISEIQREILDMTASQNFSGYVNSVRVADIQSALNSDELLLDYYCVHYSDVQLYVCLAVTADKVDMLSVGNIDEIDTLVCEITNAVLSEDISTESEMNNASNANRNTMPSAIQKIKKLLQFDTFSPKRVIVCPDGELYRFPFDILSLNIEVVYVTNAKDIVRNNNGTGKEHLIKDIYVFADPLFSQNDEQNGGYFEEQSQERSKCLSRLPGTYVEANIISRIFGDKVKQFNREKASRAALLENCNADILHIASHAADSDGGIIYLSGANDYLNSSDSESCKMGYVTSHDIAKLDMTKTKLAVLSACRTGVGEYRSYSGVRGLRRSFQLAGAEAVLSTMWNISDLATAIFMYAFYSKYNVCNDVITALCFAKSYIKTATIRKIKDEIYSEVSGILLKSESVETYREFRDMIQFGDETDIPFFSPFYWAGFSLYK